MDLRPPMGSAMVAFSVPATVTRPAPDATPVPTTGIWLTSLVEVRPFGTDFQRRDPRRVLSVTRDAILTHIPRGSTIVAPEQVGWTPKTWRVDGYERVDSDDMRLILIAIAGT